MRPVGRAHPVTPGDVFHLYVSSAGGLKIGQTRGVTVSESRFSGNYGHGFWLDLSVYAGEIYGFLGVNGAGKTTTIRMLMGIIAPDQGTIELLGEKSKRTTLKQKQRIGYVSQDQTFYPWMTAEMLGRFVGGLYPTWDAAEYRRLLNVLEVPTNRTSRFKGFCTAALWGHPEQERRR